MAAHAAEWLEQHVKQLQKPGTYDVYERTMRLRRLPLSGARPLDSLPKGEIMKALGPLRTQGGQGPGAVALALSVLATCLAPLLHPRSSPGPGARSLGGRK